MHSMHMHTSNRACVSVGIPGNAYGACRWSRRWFGQVTDPFGSGRASAALQALLLLLLQQRERGSRDSYWRAAQTLYYQ